MRSLFIILWITLLTTISACDEEEVQAEGLCILDRIIYEDSGSLKFETVSGGKFYQVKDQVLEENNEYRTLSTFQFNYQHDEVIVNNLNQPSLKPILVITNNQEGKPKEIVRYFPESGITLTHLIDYSEPDLITDEITWLSSDGTSLRFGVSNYYFDPSGNVTRSEVFRYDPQDQSTRRLLEDRIYTYDDSSSPWQGLILPFLTTPVIDIKFFSANNITSFEDSSERHHFEYLYNNRNKPVQLNSVSSGLIEFVYANCSN